MLIRVEKPGILSFAGPTAARFSRSDQSCGAGDLLFALSPSGGGAVRLDGEF